jgi:hypothetical protein
MSGVEVRQLESEELTVCILSLACKHAQMQNYTHEIEPKHVSFSSCYPPGESCIKHLERLQEVHKSIETIHDLNLTGGGGLVVVFNCLLKSCRSNLRAWLLNNRSGAQDLLVWR